MSGKCPIEKKVIMRRLRLGLIDFIKILIYINYYISPIIYTAAVSAFSAFGQNTQLAVMNTLIPAAIHSTL